jgi:16S rRNA (guanine527-N7)-methyltransferase
MMPETIQQALDTLGQDLPAGAADKLSELLGELVRWNQKVNLTAIREPAAMISGHLLDSLAVRPFLRGTRILDVGTGAGFPGLPLAIAEPERHFELVDSNNKKIQFVQHVAARLGLANVRAVKARSENYAPDERFDTVLARAVAGLPDLIRIAGHLVDRDGVFIALKGRYPAEELKALPDTWSYSVEMLDIPGLETGSRHVVLMQPKKP